MTSMPQDPPLWRQAIDAAINFFIAAELMIEEVKVHASEGARKLAEGAFNFTTTALENLAHPLRLLPRFNNRRTIHTFLIGPGCDVVSPSCIVRQCNTTEDLRAVMPIAAGPYAVDTTASYVNIDAWSFPVFYVYDPNYWDNYTRSLGYDDDKILGETINTAHQGANPVFRYPALASADTSLVLFDLPSGTGVTNGNIIPVGVLAFIYIFSVFCVLYHFGILPLGRYVVGKYKTYAKANAEGLATIKKANNSNDAEARIRSIEARELAIVHAYVPTIERLNEDVDRKYTDLQRSSSEKASLQSQLLACKSDKQTLELHLRERTSQKETVEGDLRKCQSETKEAEIALETVGSAHAEALQRVDVLNIAVIDAQTAQSKAETAQREARKEVASVRKDANAKIERAEEDAEKRVKASEQDAEKKVKQAHADANKQATSARQEADTKVKQAEEEADKAKSAQKEAEDKVELTRQKYEKNFASAQQEAKENLDSAEQESKEKLKAAQQEANRAFKLVHDEAEKKLKSVHEEAETKLNTTTATYKRREKDLEAVLSTAESTIRELQPYKDEAAEHSNEAARWRRALNSKQEEHREYVSRMNEQHSAVLEASEKKHLDKLDGLREEQKAALQEQEDKHRQQVQDLEGNVNGYTAMKIQLASAKDAREASEKQTESLHQQLSQLQHDTGDYQDVKAENKKLGSDKATLQAQLQKITNEKQTKSEEFKSEKKYLQEQLQSTQTRLKTATAQFEANQGSLQEKLQGVQAQLKTASAQHQSTEESLKAQVEQAKESMSRVEAANKDLSQKVDGLEELTKSKDESIMSKDDRIHHLQNEKKELLGVKEGVATELPAMKSALEKAERSDEEIEQHLESTADKKQKRRNRRKHRNCRYSTDRADDTNSSESGGVSEGSPVTQTFQQPTDQPLGTPSEQELEEVTEGLSNVAFNNDTAIGDGEVAGEAAETDMSAKDRRSSDCRSTFQFLADAASFVPGPKPRFASAGCAEEAEASSTPTRSEATRAEGRTHTPTVVEEGITELEGRPSPASSALSGVDESDTSTFAREVHEREAPHTASPTSGPCERLTKMDEAVAAKQDQPPVFNTSKVSKIQAETINGNGDTAMHVSASPFGADSKPTPGSSAPITTGSPTTAQSSTTKALQLVNAGTTTPTAKVKLHEPRSGRPDFVTAELAAQRAEDLKKSKWATQTPMTTKVASGQGSAPCKSAQILKSCIDDAKANAAGKQLQSSRWASVASEVKKPVDPMRSPPQIVPSTTQSGKTTNPATAASKAIPPAGPWLSAKAPRPADPTPVALGSVTLPPAAASPAATSATGTSAATAPTATALNTGASVSVPQPVRASQYSFSAHAAAVRPSDTPERGRGIGPSRGLGRGPGGRGGGGGGRGRGRGMVPNHKLPDWLAEDLVKRAAEAQSCATTPQRAPSAANDSPTAVAAGVPASAAASRTIDGRTTSTSSSVQGLEIEIKNKLSESKPATNNYSAISSKAVPDSQIGSDLLQSKHASKREIKHQLFESKYATNSGSGKDTTTTSKPKVKSDLLQPEYTTTD